MIRRLSLIALLALWPALASAQFATIGPTAPPTDNGDRLATTAWVNNFFAAGIPLASGKLFVGSVGGIATQQSLSGDCTLIASGVITCTQAAGNFNVIGSLTVGGLVIDASGELQTNIVAPATPAAGLTRVYVDSTTKVLTFKNDAGLVGNAVVPSTAVATQYMTGISAAGVITRQQPNFTDLAGQGSCAQEPALTGNVTSSAGSCATTIGANQVTRAMEAQGLPRSVVGVTGNATANVADIQGTANQFLGVNPAGTALAFQSLRQMVGLSNGTVVMPQATTAFETSIWSVTEGAVSMVCPIGGTFKNLFLNVTAPASGQTLTATFRVNGAGTALTCTVTGTGTTCNDTTHTATCTAGQTWDLGLVTSATTGTLGSISGGVEFDNP